MCWTCSPKGSCPSGRTLRFPRRGDCPGGNILNQTIERKLGPEATRDLTEWVGIPRPAAYYPGSLGLSDRVSASMAARRKRNTGGTRTSTTRKTVQPRSAPKPAAQPPVPPALSGFARHRARAIELFHKLRAWVLRRDKDASKRDMKNLREELREVKQRSPAARAMKAQRK